MLLRCAMTLLEVPSKSSRQRAGVCYAHPHKAECLGVRSAECWVLSEMLLACCQNQKAPRVEIEITASKESLTCNFSFLNSNQMVWQVPWSLYFFEVLVAIIWSVLRTRLGVTKNDFHRHNQSCLGPLISEPNKFDVPISMSASWGPFGRKKDQSHC